MRGNWGVGVGDETMVAIDGGGHWRRGHGFQTGTFSLGAEGQWASEGATAILVVCHSKPDDADNDDDDSDEGHYASDYADN